MADYLIWSFEHNGWWRPGALGYTKGLADFEQAGRFPFEQALALCTEANLVGLNEAMVPIGQHTLAAMELKTYELEVEVRVRRTMRVKAPNRDAAKVVAWGFLSLTAEGRGELSSVLKWTDGRIAYRPMPVETLLLDPETVFASEPVEVVSNGEGPKREISG